MAGIGGGSSALGSVANLFSSKMLMKYQYKLQRRARGEAYQITMADMRKAGLNPILAYQRGPTGGGQVSLAQSPNFGNIGAGISAGAQAGAATQQAGSAKKVRGEQGKLFRQQGVAADAAAALSIATAEGVRFENVLKKEQADWALTPEGKMAIHGKMIGGVWGPPAAAALEMLKGNIGNSLKGPPRAPNWLEIYPPPDYNARPKNKQYKGGK